jgi:CFEM domain
VSRNQQLSDKLQQSCLIPVVGSLNCNFTTLPQLSRCLCPDIPAQRKVSACVQSACTITEQYGTAVTLQDPTSEANLISVVSKASQLLCTGYPVPSRGPELKATVIVLSAVTIPLILLRIFWRQFATKWLWWDDFMMLVCGVI